MSLRGFYEKISETTQNWLFDSQKQRNTLFNKTEWVVTEKVHGSNLCWVVGVTRDRDDRERIRCAKRRELIDENSGQSFFQHDLLRERISGRIESVVQEVLHKYAANAKCVHIYGEIFGGHYPHPQVQLVHTVQPVQTGVWYCPGIEFMAFDIAVIEEDDICDGRKRYLDL